MSGSALAYHRALTDADIFAYVKDVRPDWSSFTTGLALKYGGLCGLAFHDHSTPQVGMLINTSENSLEKYVHEYSTIFHLNPWKAFFWASRPGTVFAGSDATPKGNVKTDPARTDETFKRWMTEQEAFRGMAATLFRAEGPDKAPTLTVNLVVLRGKEDDESAVFTEEDKEFPKRIVGELQEIVATHPLVRTWGAYRAICSDAHRRSNDFTPLPADLEMTLVAYRRRLLVAGRESHIVDHDTAILQMVLVEAALPGPPSPDGPPHAPQQPSSPLPADQTARAPSPAPPGGTPAPEPPSGKGTPPPTPTSLAEARAYVPALLEWKTAKERQPALTIEDHLRHATQGLGKWTVQGTGLPLTALRKIDKGAWKEYYNWRGAADEAGRHANELAPDIKLLRRSDIARQGVTLSSEESRDASRKASLLRRMKRNARGLPSR